MILTTLEILALIVNLFFIFRLYRRNNKLQRETKKISLDIISLQRNQNRLVLTIKELYRELRKRDKTLKRQIRPRSGSKETGTEED